MTDTVGNWFSILDYAQAKNISISTIRRGIKSNRLKHKIENGKYFIFSTKLTTCMIPVQSNTNNNEEFLINENKLLRERVKKLSQELDEYKMLVDVYEQHQKIPELPQHL